MKVGHLGSHEPEDGITIDDYTKDNGPCSVRFVAEVFVNLLNISSIVVKTWMSESRFVSRFVTRVALERWESYTVWSTQLNSAYYWSEFQSMMIWYLPFSKLPFSLFFFQMDAYMELPPNPGCNRHHQDYERTIFRIRNSKLNLHLWLLLGGG